MFDFHGNYRFKVYVDGVFSAVFTECTLPGLTVETTEIKEGGQNEYTHKLPQRVKVGNVRLKHGFTRDMELLNWYMQVLNGDVERASRQLVVQLYNTVGDPIAEWSFINAYPVKWSGPSLKADDRAVAIEEIELVHHGFEVRQ